MAKRLEVEFIGDISSLERAQRKLQRENAALRRQFDELGASGQKSGAETDALGRKIDKTSDSTKRLGREFDDMSGRKKKADSLISRNVTTFGNLSQTITGTKSAVNALGGGFGALGMTLGAVGPLAIAAAGSTFALVSALGPLAGLAGAGAVALTGFAQAAGVVAFASMGVGDALKEQMDVTGKAAKLATSGANQQKAAARAVAQAQEGVRSANERVRSATESLTLAEKARTEAVNGLRPAQTQARRDLVDMGAAAARAATGEQQAVRALTEARKALEQAQNPADVAKLTLAQSALTTSTLNERRAVAALTDARQALDDLMKPADALTLADAQDAVADATRDQERAALALGKAQAAAEAAAKDPTMSEADKAEAKLALADAENAVGDASRSSARAQQQLQKLQAGPDPADIAKAKLDIADAENAVADASASTAQATRDIQEAQKAADPEAVAAATLDVAEAEQTLADAVRERRRLTKDLAAAERAGVNGSEVVVTARQRIADANRQVTAADRQLTEAERDVTKALQAVKDAQKDAASSAGALAASNVDLNEKFNALPPAAQAFVRTLQGMKPKLDAIRAAAAAGLFPGVTAGLNAAMGSFGSVNKVTGETASVLGGLARRAGELVGSGAFGRDLETIGGRNALIIDRVGRGAINLGSAFRHLLVAAGPLTTWLAKVFVEWTRGVEAAAETGRETGKLGEFFQSTRNTLIRVVSILGNLGEAFFNVSKSAAPFGRDILESIDRISGRFAAWSKSIEGQNALQDFFRQSNALMAVFVPAIGDAAESLGGLAFSVLPAYAAVLAALGPLAGPLLQAFIGYKLALTAVTIALNLAKAAQVVYTAVTKGGVVYTVAAKVATLAMAAATKAWAAGQWLLNAALTANPIGLVVVGLVALGAGLVLAYKKSETFRNIVNGALKAVKTVAVSVFGWVTDNWKLLAGILLGPFSLVLAAVTKFGPDIIAGIQAGLSGLKTVFVDPLIAAWNWVLDFFGVHSPSTLFAELGGNLIDGLVGGLKAGLSALLGAAKWVGDQLVAGVKAYASIYKDVGGWVIARVIDGVKALADVVMAVGGWLKNRLNDGVVASVDGLKTIGTWILSRIVEGIKAVADGIVAIGGWIKNRIADGLNASIDAIKGLGGVVLGWFVAGFKATVDGVEGIGGWLKNRISDGLEAAKDGILGLGGTVIGWIIEGLKKGAFELQGFLNKIIDVINKIPGVDIAHITALKKDDKGNVSGFARGGAYARTGGVVSSPITLMGEEAPRHPEFVIPTNPAYRPRAQALAKQAANAVGLATGGIYTASKFGGHDDPSAFGKQTASGKIANDSLWGFAELSDPPSSLNFSALGGLPMGTTIDIGFNGKTAKDVPKVDVGAGGPGLDGHVRAVDMTYAVAQALGFSGLGNISVNGGGGGGGVFAKVGDALHDAVGSVADIAGSLIGKLPGVGGLGWLAGTGKYVLGQAKDWIKHKVSGLFGSGGDGSGGQGLGGGMTAGGKLQLPTTFQASHPTGGLAGYPAIDVFGKPGTTVLSPADATVSRFSGGPDSYTGPGGPFGYSMYLDSAIGQYFLTHFGSRSVGVGDRVKYGDPLGTIGDYPGSVPDHIHEGLRRLAEGGVFGGLPFLGAYHDGGVAPQEGLAHVLPGEVMTPRGRQQPEMRIRVVVEDHTTRVYIDDVEQVVERVIDERDRDMHGAYTAG